MQRALLFVLTLIISCFAFGEERSWDFVESVGGLAYEKPIKTAKGWELPIKVDVSGTQTITKTPTAMNSALACKIKSWVDGIAIYITLITEPAGADSSSQCTKITLGEIPNGDYLLLYWSTPDSLVHRVGKLKIES